ncbi:MAG TPA: lysylphosphatidylglycerol synthase transmembrane domain-containing protein, partial [Thermoleophilia bacterium]|nr:lysylphosphatidylglycerol synthase transmembrane domain-containing protein [Thermoleophilia bacterium]
WAVVGRRDELAGATSYLARIHFDWVAIAVVAEAFAIVSFAVLQQRLLRAGRVGLGLPTLTAITLGGNAIQSSFPGGAAWSAVWSYRQFRHRGADELLSGWTLIATTILSQITLVLLAGAGLLLAKSQGSSLDLVSVIVGLVVAALAIVVLWRERWVVVRGVVAMLRLWQRFSKRLEGDPAVLVNGWVERANAISPSREDWAVSTLMALANWVWDCAALAAAFLAVGAHVPWRGLLLAYGAAQLAANLPITPGGLGVVEGSLTVALVAYGGAEASTVAAVLLYRLIAFWALLPVGWGAWGLVTTRTRALLGRAALEEAAA